MKKALELDEQAVAAIYGLGNFYFKQEEFAKAQESFQQAISLGMEESDVYYMLALSLLNQELGRLAIPYLMRASELAPTDEDILFQYGLTLAKCNFIDESQKVFDQLLQLNPNHSDAHYNQGIIAAYYDQLHQALEHFETAVRIQPDHVLAANGVENMKKKLNQS